ncbi:hypothetical protein [Mesorhizobium prunaredense]|nr:hypothetical protein [Mesorhizobium prunaredense]
MRVLLVHAALLSKDALDGLLLGNAPEPDYMCARSAYRLGRKVLA